MVVCESRARKGDIENTLNCTGYFVRFSPSRWFSSLAFYRICFDKCLPYHFVCVCSQNVASCLSSIKPIRSSISRQQQPANEKKFSSMPRKRRRKNKTAIGTHIARLKMMWTQKPPSFGRKTGHRKPFMYAMQNANGTHQRRQKKNHRNYMYLYKVYVT